jgi:hypothetical protein
MTNLIPLIQAALAEIDRADLLDNVKIRIKSGLYFLHGLDEFQRDLVVSDSFSIIGNSAGVTEVTVPTEFRSLQRIIPLDSSDDEIDGNFPRVSTLFERDYNDCYIPNSYIIFGSKIKVKNTTSGAERAQLLYFAYPTITTVSETEVNTTSWIAANYEDLVILSYKAIAHSLAGELDKEQSLKKQLFTEVDRLRGV